MAIDTYANLQTAIADQLNRTDLATVIPDWILLAEALFENRPELRREVRGTLTLDQEVITLPAALREIVSVRLDQSDARGELEIIPLSVLPEKKVFLSSTGKPRYGAITTNGTELILSPVPDQTYTAQFEYLEKLSRLSATQTSNWVLAENPNIYFYGALLHSAPYLRDDARLATWASLYEQALKVTGDIAEQRRFSGHLVRRPRRAIG